MIFAELNSFAPWSLVFHEIWYFIIIQTEESLPWVGVVPKGDQTKRRDGHLAMSVAAAVLWPPQISTRLWAQLSATSSWTTWCHILWTLNIGCLNNFGFSIFMFQRINSSAIMSRTMVYPYTIGAMIKAFPLKYHIDKSWVFKVFHHSSALRRLDNYLFKSHFWSLVIPVKVVL